MTLENICSMADRLPGNYVVLAAGTDGVKVMHYTRRLWTLTGFDESPKEALNYDAVLEDDREMLRNTLKVFLNARDTPECELLFRMIHKSKGFIWVHLLARKFAEVDGRVICLANLVDATKETMISYALMDSSERYICVIEKSTKRILYGNAKFYDLVDSSPAEAVGHHCYELLCKVLAMKENDNCLCYSSLNADPPIETYNPVKKMNLTITGREVVWGEYDAYVFYMTDITEKKQREAELADSQKRFEVALENSDLMVWEYDIANSRCIASQKATSGYAIPLIIENYPESLYDMGHTPPETVAQIKECKRRLLNGETGFSVERRTIDKDGRSEWQKVKYTLECDAEGKPIRAIVCGLDITRQKELEEKYEEQIEYRNKLAQNARFSIRLNLDEDTIVDHTSTDARLNAIAEQANGAADFLESFFKTSVFTPESGLTRQKLTKAALLENYYVGQSQYQTVYRCSLLNLYFDLDLTLYKNPGSDHVEVFFVITDVTQSVLMQSAYQRVVTASCDFVAIVNPETGKVMFLAHAEGTPLPPHTEDGVPGDYDRLITAFIDSNRGLFYTEKEYTALRRGLTLAGVQKKLEAAPVYEVSCKMHAGGEMRTYRLSYAYSDANREQIVFTRSNITQVVLEEQKNQKLLEKALEAANSANRAKTDFLSRMSHDMRTPMNGIIGMTRLTQDIAGLPAEAQGNLAAIAESSAYLLHLINDTLDMNKIESSKFRLNPEVVNVQELVAHVLSSIRPLAAAKQIAVEFVPINAELEYIRIDRVRVQQIFLNILSNAVKFTPEHGRIRIELECLRRENGIAYDRISIEDSGCGMSDAFLQDIYKPFTQENTRIVNGQEGTGLGMAIVKSLVELMNGRIEIESTQGVGTKVTVYLDFERVCDTETAAPDAEAAAEENLAGKHVLLAEDHPLNATIATRLLKKKGVEVEHAENGAVAVQMFASSPLHSYDAILMDIRMPEMDGLTAARTIRALGREDAKTVPILAMTANAYAEDVRLALDAGMNAHMAKPIEPETLYRTLAAYL